MTLTADRALAQRPQRMAPLSGVHVCVAEDDPEMRRLIVDSLLRDGARVDEAPSGLALFDRLRRASLENDLPDILVSDIRMPGLTGLQMTAVIRDRGWGMPIVLVTAFGDEETHDAAAAVGATVVFDKPFDIDDLRTAVQHFLGRGRR